MNTQKEKRVTNMQWHGFKTHYTITRPPNYHLSGEHDNINLQAVLKSIGHATGVKYKKEKDYILLYQ